MLIVTHCIASLTLWSIQMPPFASRHHRRSKLQSGALLSIAGLTLWLSGPVSAESTQEPQAPSAPPVMTPHRLIPPPKHNRMTLNPDAQATPSPPSSRAAQPNGERKPAVRVPNVASSTIGSARSTAAGTRRESSVAGLDRTNTFALPDVTGPTSQPAPERTSQAPAVAAPSTSGHSLMRSGASVTTPAVPLTPADLGGTRSAGTQGAVFGAPTTAANAGAAAPGAPTAGRGFTNLLNRFPTLAPTLQADPATLPPSAPAPGTPNSLAPGVVPPVPQVNAPAPATPPPAGTSYGQTVLHWNANGEGDLAGYKIYVGTQSGVYNYPGSPFNVGRTTSTTISNLPRGQTYFFVATAYDQSGNESGQSAEVSKSLY